MKTNLIAISLLALSTACIDSAPGSDPDPGNESPDKIAVNSLLPSNLVASSLGLAKLDASAMTTFANEGSAARATLSYIFSCAYPSTSSFSVTIAGTQYTFTGAYDLALYWGGAPLTTADRQLMSACVLSRVNYYGDAVNISMRGSSSTLATTSQELQNYILEEGAFYGDVLGGPSNLAIHTCMGSDAASQPNTGDLDFRRCTEGASGVGQETLCSFIYDGLCSSVCSVTVGSAGHYDQCNGYTNTVTTFLQD